jgi:hyaluronoglucosaminidase
MRFSARAALALLVTAAVAGCTSAPAPTPKAEAPARSTVTHAPVTGPMRLLTGASADGPARDLVNSALAGSKVDVAEGSTVLLGNLSDPKVAGALRQVNDNAPQKLAPQGYAVAIGDSGGKTTAVLAGADADGQYYAAQRFAALTRAGKLPSTSVVEEPKLRKRGVIEGFYGPPWTQKDRLDQLAFYGDMRLNTYIYSPKDDPKLRSEWRQPYNAQEIGQLRQLVSTARQHHVTFTYALSPGLSICYSAAGDRKAVRDKLQQLYDIGVRDFNIPLDDIEYQWADGCGDQQRYGPPSQGNVARAHVGLVNSIERQFIQTHPGSQPLEMTPTDYSGLKPSAYTQAVRSGLDKRIKVMWTGKYVVPASINTSEAMTAHRNYGTAPYVWDNYPVNDFDFGRLMLGPYTHRSPDLPSAVSGIVLNPMPEAAANKVALATFADYAWQGPSYNPYASRDKAAEYLSGGDPKSAQALRAFFDTENLPARPESYDDPALEPQAPLLASKIAAFQKQYAGGDKKAAVARLRAYASLLASAESTLANGPADRGFVADTREWLHATSLWGKALGRTLDGLEAKAGRNQPAASAAFAQSAQLASQAAGVTTKRVSEGDPPEPVKVADGVLDAFLKRAPKL